MPAITGDWTRRLGRLLLEAVELGLATIVLLSLAILGDIRAGVQRGDYTPEAAGGVGFWLLLIWFSAGLALAAIRFLHALGWTYWTDRDRAAAVRVGAELAVAVIIVAIATDGAVPTDLSQSLRTATAVLSMLAFVRALANAARFVRTTVGGLSARPATRDAARRLPQMSRSNGCGSETV